MQLKLFDTGRKADAPGQTLLFEDENQQPRDTPPLVSPKPTYRLLASSPSLQGITTLIIRFYGGSAIEIVGEEVHNSKGKIEGVRVVKAKGRYRFEG